jgi:magnesium chelatase subunit I
VAKHVIGKAVNNVFTRYFPAPRPKPGEANPYTVILNWFKDGNHVELSDRMSEKEYRKVLDAVEGLPEVVKKYVKDAGERRYELMDLVLESLHQNSMLGKEDMDQQRSFSDMLGSMLGGMGDPDVDDEEGDFSGFN